MWRGGFGMDKAAVNTVESMELCSGPHEKYGDDVDEITIDQKDRTVFNLTSGNWAYGNQIEPMLQEA